MKTAASYIKKKYDCYKDYSEQSIRDVCHIWCEVIEEAQNDVKKEYEEKLRWIPVTEKMPENLEWVDCKSGVGDHYVGCYLENYGIKTGEPATITHWRSFL